MPPAKTHPSVYPLSREACLQKNPARGARILLVDDDELLRELVAEALIMNGYEVVYAQDGEEGWDSLCKLEFDLLITDHNMPRLSGFDLINRMKSRPSQVRTIMITGYLPLQFPESANTLPFCEVMAKPFSLKELLQKVDNSLRLLEA
jgi:DNA-binding response OmpR family regulator